MRLFEQSLKILLNKGLFYLLYHNKGNNKRQNKIFFGEFLRNPLQTGEFNDIIKITFTKFVQQLAEV